MDIEARKEALSAARHYGGMRFAMMAAFFIFSGLLINALNSQSGLFSPQRIAELGIAASAWFTLFEFILSYNLTKLWANITAGNGGALAGAWPQRNYTLVWVGRLLLPFPYLGALSVWLALHPAACTANLSIAVPTVAWLLMWLGWGAAAKGRW